MGMIRLLMLLLAVVAGLGSLLSGRAPWSSGGATPEERIDQRIQRNVADYNARLGVLAKPGLRPREVRIDGQTLTIPFEVDEMIAPGSRNSVTTRVRGLSRNTVCDRFLPAIRAGWRVVFVITDPAGSGVRVGISAQDC